MTVNELIAKLKDYGDEKARDLAKVRIVNVKGEVLEDNLDSFDVKYGINSVDIPVDAYLFYPSNGAQDDDDDIWEDDEDEDEVDNEDEDEEDDAGYNYLEEPVQT